MIQRIQTLFLALAILANVPVLFLKLADASIAPDSPSASMEDPSIHLFGMRLERQYLNSAELSFVVEELPMSGQPMLIGHLVAVLCMALLSLAAIFLYKKRPLQAKLVYVALVVLLVQILLELKLYMDLPGMLGQPPEGVKNDFGFALFLPAAAVLLLWGAARRIQADERMVKDMDRIR